MERVPDHQPEPLRINGVFLDFQHATISLLGASGVVLIRFQATGLAQFKPTIEGLEQFVTGERSTPLVPGDQVAEPLDVAAKAPTLVLSGVLKSTPRPGRQDRSGKPTVWAKAAMHQDGTDSAALMLLTFHRHTTMIAASLVEGSAIVAEGYRHAPASTAKLPTFSVFNLLQYPGKPQQPSPQA